MQDVLDLARRLALDALRTRTDRKDYKGSQFSHAALHYSEELLSDALEELLQHLNLKQLPVKPRMTQRISLPICSHDGCSMIQSLVVLTALLFAKRVRTREIDLDVRYQFSGGIGAVDKKLIQTLIAVHHAALEVFLSALPKFNLNSLTVVLDNSSSVESVYDDFAEIVKTGFWQASKSVMSLRTFQLTLVAYQGGGPCRITREKHEGWFEELEESANQMQRTRLEAILILLLGGKDRSSPLFMLPSDVLSHIVRVVKNSFTGTEVLMKGLWTYPHGWKSDHYSDLYVDSECDDSEYLRNSDDSSNISTSSEEEEEDEEEEDSEEEEEDSDEEEGDE